MKRDAENDRTASADEDRLWTANDVADFLRVSRSWVYQRAEAGELPCVRVGALLRFEPERIKGYVRGQRPAVVALRRG